MKITPMLIEQEALKKEVFFKMSRSSGNGGQNVDKVATKATLFFNLATSQLFSETKKEYVLDKLKSRLTKDGVLIITSQNTRSALKNKKEAIKKLKFVLQEAAHQPKKRKPSRTSVSVHLKRLDYKKRQSFKKSLRRKVNRNSVDLF